MSSSWSVHCGGGGYTGLLAATPGGSLISATLSPLSTSLLLVFIMVGMSEGVPTTQDFRGGQKEIAVIPGRSLYWPYVVTGDARQNLDKRTSAQPIQLCGYRLLEAVRGLCRGNYVGYSRRSDPEMQDEEHQGAARDVAEQDSPSVRRYNHQNSNSNHFRFRRSIIDECCMKPCSVNEMLRYCGRT